MSIMTADRTQQLIDIVEEQWEEAIGKWEQIDHIVFYEEIQKLLCESACKWIGISIKDDKIDKITKKLASLFESAAAIGPAYWIGKHSRKRR